MFSTRIFVCLVLLASICLAQQKQQTIPELFKGVWNLQITEYKQVEGKLAPSGEDLNVVLNVSEGSNKHTAIFTDWERELNYKITVDWLSITSGEVRIADIKASQEEEKEGEGEQEFVGKSDDFVQTGNEQVLFGFDFVNRTNAYLFSHGEFHGLNNKFAGSYQITFPSSFGFVMSVFTKDGSTLMTITGAKVIVQPEQQWWQRLTSSPIAMVGVFLVMRMVLSRQNIFGGLFGGGEAPVAAGETGTRGLAAGGRARQAGAARATPTVEDVSDKKKD